MSDDVKTEAEIRSEAAKAIEFLDGLDADIQSKRILELINMLDRKCLQCYVDGFLRGESSERYGEAKDMTVYQAMEYARLDYLERQRMCMAKMVVVEK